MSVDSASTASPWTDSSYQEAVLRLDKLHNQVTSLRAEIPLLIDTLKNPSQSPTTLYESFAGLAFKLNDQINSLANQFRQSDNLKSLQHAAELRSSVADGSSLPMAHDWEMILPFRQREEEDDELSMVEIQVDDDRGNNPQERQEALTKVQDECKGFHVASKSESDEELSIDVAIDSKPQKLRFKFQYDRAHSSIICKGESELHQSITRCCQQAAKQHGYENTLRQLAAYAGPLFQACHTCKQILDSAALVPTARRLVKKGSGVEWHPYHEHCRSQSEFP